MKKLGKFIFASLSVAAVAGSAYYLVKNIINKDSNDEFDDFEDEFDDFDLDDDDEETVSDSSKEERGYVTLSFQEEENTEQTEDLEEELTDESSDNIEVSDEETDSE